VTVCSYTRCLYLTIERYRLITISATRVICLTIEGGRPLTLSSYTSYQSLFSYCDRHTKKLFLPHQSHHLFSTFTSDSSITFFCYTSYLSLFSNGESYKSNTTLLHRLLSVPFCLFFCGFSLHFAYRLPLHNDHLMYEI
jgi:hypothetical protein